MGRTRRSFELDLWRRVEGLRVLLRKSPLYRPYSRWKYQRSSEARQAYFRGIYQDNVWSDNESRSGGGSSLEATSHLRSELPAFLASLNVHSMLDLPCGDFTWMKHVDLGSIDYMGADIVPEVIDSLRNNYGNQNRRFEQLDLLSDRLPYVDVIMCRDLLSHLPYAFIFTALRNMKMSDSRYLLTSCYPGIEANADIDMGGWRPLNFLLPPFLWPPPLAVLYERSPVDRADKTLAVWALPDL